MYDLSYILFASSCSSDRSGYIRLCVCVLVRRCVRVYVYARAHVLLGIMHHARSFRLCSSRKLAGTPIII